VAEDSGRLASFIKDSEYTASIDCFRSGEEFLASFTSGWYDLIFLDVYMGGINGVDVAEVIRRTDFRVVIIFTTTSEDFTKESYRLNAYKYLVKPFSPADVTDALELARLKRDKVISDVYTIIVDGKAVKIPLDDIYYADVHGYKSLLHVTDGIIEVNTTIDNLEKLLPPPRFLRCHRSFVVNLDYVKGIDDGDFVMVNGDKAYIRVKDFRKIKTAYESYLYDEARRVRRAGLFP
jgi:DNA-binding LytR/AlgR family response regulator